MSDAVPYKRGTRIPRLLGVRNYLNNYFAMYKRLTRSRIRVELASPGYMGFEVPLIINLLSPNRMRTSFSTRNLHPSAIYVLQII